MYWDVLKEFGAEEYKDVMVAWHPDYRGSQRQQQTGPRTRRSRRSRVRSGGTIEGWVIEAARARPRWISRTGELATSMERGLADSLLPELVFGLITGVKDTTKYRTELNMFYRTWRHRDEQGRLGHRMPADVPGSHHECQQRQKPRSYLNGEREALAAEDKGS